MTHWRNRTIHLTLLALIIAAAAACDRSEVPAAADEVPAAATATPAEPRTDAAIVTNVQAKYYGDDLVRGRNLSVLAEQGVVTLRGAVSSDAAKERAVSLARSVAGVREVKDELQVETAAATQSADSTGPSERQTGTAGRVEKSVEPGWITTKIQAQYFVNPEIKPWNIDVTTNSSGLVTLAGEVEEAADRTEAVRIARETEGVTGVEDHLRVKGEASADSASLQRPDVWLTAKIQSKYFLDDDVKGRNIDVTTQNGIVTLKGSVASEGQKRTAVALARNTEGVKQVNDQLTIDSAAGAQRTETRAVDRNLTKVPDLKRPDSWITMKVQSQFFLDDDIKAHEINVDTSRGVVLLKGTVASDAQKQQAEKIARETDGVVRVVNELTVVNQ